MEKAWELAALVMSAGLKKRDYKSFGPIAKVRFRPMCEALGFEQTTATEYSRERNGWFDVFGLKTSQWGGNSFQIYWGIKRDINQLGIDSSLYHFLKRQSGKPTFWNRFTKADIEENAKEASEQFMAQAEPFLQRLKTKQDLGWYFWDCNEKTLRELLSKRADDRTLYEKDVYIRACDWFEWADLKKLRSSMSMRKVPLTINIRRNRQENLRFLRLKKTIM